MKKNKLMIIYGFSFLFLGLDQFIKFLVINNLNILEEIPVISNFFKIIYVENKGAAFGILDGNTTILAIISVIAFIFLTKYLKRETNISKIATCSYILLIGGLMGNLLDRIVHHAVIDYLSFNFWSISFPIFNLADIGIVSGLLLLIMELMKGDTHEYIESNERRTH
ncbi:MAG: signal peptidase II [Bacilli bacterium]